MKIILVCATDNKIDFSDEHFGSAKYYLFYEFDLEKKNIVFLKSINNYTPQEEEEKHGDPKKAKSVSELLKNVSVFVANKYGPNIKRIKKRFVPIVSRERNIEKALSRIKKINHQIKTEIEKENKLDKKIIFIKREEIAN
ncbi:MAG: NifB/NifX family molybdenum-iron cluster-binding protein [Candidatus Caldatribacteriota bacterium]|nr:NifB/NifX family molybdenum-iron cluster-binding protein [Candidatus Caldatribacteriota bacterium]